MQFVRASIVGLLPFLGVAACGDIPGQDITSDPALEAAPYPAILPQHALPEPQAGRLTDTSEDEIDARGARLKRRASTL
ncbi:MAG: hypothetical protein JJ868_13995 [Shimia sp.]|uniref:hypothetical protein n=1 Tax=Shimia sp. TaxID=1954381 RepID=UPI001B0244C2|nr:hypothetical protein [Shimia sp.]MBO6898479.1 hypothetical protein [Shimia sp.]